MPIPTLMEGDQAGQANYEISDHLFLRLANLGQTLTTAGDAGFVPQLARSWTRRDSVTLVFELDPRARWHDGVPVTSRDVVFTMKRARDPSISPRVAKLLRYITAVEAEGDRTVVFRFARVYAEQLYDATFHTAMLPAHLLAGLPPDSLARSAYASHPVGNGPYRWVRRVPGQLIELAANDQFFLGRPSIAEVDRARGPGPGRAAQHGPERRGRRDGQPDVPLPRTRPVSRPGPSSAWSRFPPRRSAICSINQRAPGDSTRPHPILSRPRGAARAHARPRPTGPGEGGARCVRGGALRARPPRCYGSGTERRSPPRRTARPPSDCWSREDGWTGTETGYASVTASRSCCDCWSPTPAPSADRWRC